MNRNLLQWEAAHLIPPATLEEAASDPRIARTAKELDGLMKLNPPLRAMHPFGATLAQECVSLFMYDVRTLALETQAHVPSYARWLEQADMAPAYAQHRLALQALQSAPTHRAVGAEDPEPPVGPRRPARRLPGRPDRVDPPGPGAGGDVPGQPGQRRPTPAHPPADPRPTAEEWKRKCRVRHRLGHRVRRAGRTRDGADTSTTTSSLADPVEAVRGLYRSFGEDVSELHARRMQAFLEQRPQDAFGRHVYDPADFGWTYAGLADEFAPYTARYGISVATA